VTLVLELEPALEDRLQRAAANAGNTPEEYARRVLDQALVADEERRRHQLHELLREWQEEGDAEEQSETFEALREGLNQNHSSARKIFP
jgi:hypothetical protein